MQLNGKRNAAQGELLDQHKVAFHGNANNVWRSKRLLERAGIKILAVKIHDYDLVGNLAGLNTANTRKLIGSIIYSNHLTGGSVSQSPHTTMQSMQKWEANMANGPGIGRGPLQKAFEASVKIIDNYLA